MVKLRMPRQGEIWLVVLYPTRGSEIRKTRPCLVVSPDEMNDYISTVIVVPMTTRSGRILRESEYDFVARPVKRRSIKSARST